MRFLLKGIFVIIIFLSISSCFLDARYKKLEQAKRSDMTADQYDSIVSSFYTLKAQNYSSKNNLVNFTGVYVRKYFEHDTINFFYSIIKLDSVGNIYESQKLNFLPDNKMLKRVFFYKNRYLILGDELLSEEIQFSTGDMKSHNRIYYAKISGDTLLFYKVIDLQNNKYSSFISPTKNYVYSDTLTENITYPPIFPPLNNSPKW